MVAPHHIIFAADDGFLPHTATTMASLVAANPDLPFHFHIIHTHIAPSNWSRLVDGCPHQITRNQITGHRIPDEQLHALPTYGHFTPSVYSRLFAADFIDADRALYLDSDMLVVGSLGPLLATSLNGHAVGAVDNPKLAPHPQLGFAAGERYFNSGLMLLDLAAWRQQDFRRQIIDRIAANPEAMRYLDQCALNAQFRGQWQPLHPRWNMMSHFWDNDRPHAIETFGHTAVDEALADPRIIHFTGSSKPWQLNNNHPMKARYWHFRNQTGFRSRTPDDLSVKTILRRLAPAPLARAAQRLFSR